MPLGFQKLSKRKNMMKTSVPVPRPVVSVMSFLAKNEHNGYDKSKWNRVITYLLQREHCSQGTSRLNCSSYSKIINTTAIYPPTYIGCPCHHCYKIEQGNTPLIEYAAGPYMLHPRYTRPWPIIQGGAPQIIFQNVSQVNKLSKAQSKAKAQCQICNKSFARKSFLIVHMRGHSGEKPFKCSYCPKAFAQSANLVAHQRTHTGEKPYACSVCGKCFSQSCSVTTHMRTHTGERPFQCAECGMAFAERSTLSKHYRVHAKNSVSNKDM